MEKVLTDAQVRQFRADGLLLIPGLIPESVYGPVRDDLRAARHPNETPFPYQTVAPEALPGAGTEWYSWLKKRAK